MRTTGTKKPSKKHVRYQLELQDNRCFYCQLPFGSLVSRGSEQTILEIHWDHVLPWALVGNSWGDCNYVAACQVCNLIKGSNVFDSIEDARRYVLERRKEKGYRTASVLVRENTQKKQETKPQPKAEIKQSGHLIYDFGNGNQIKIDVPILDLMIRLATERTGSVSKLADKLEVMRTVPARWRSGEFGPGRENLRKLAAAAEIPGDWVW